MPSYLYNVQTSYLIYADSQKEADKIIYEGELDGNPNVEIVDNDVMFVGIEDDDEDEDN